MQSHVSHVQPRYDTPALSAHAMYASMKEWAQSFSPISPLTTGTAAATGAMVDAQHDCVMQPEKL